MYYNSNVYSYPQYMNGPMYNDNQDIMARNSQPIFDAILAGIKGEAAAIDFYSRLANMAPNQQHQTNILHALEDEKDHLNQFINLYMTLTGTQPVYDIERVTFNTYDEGLQKAYEVELMNYEDYRQSYLLTQDSPFRDIFWQACYDEAAHAERFGSLASNIPGNMELTDYGTDPFVVNIDEATKENETFRTALWTGDNLQVTLMSIDVGSNIGLEVHPTVDQFLRIEQGQGKVQMGDSRDQLDFERNVSDDYAIMVPAGKWHNLTNTGNQPLKLYTIYAPPEHPFGTVHQTKADAMASENHD